MDKQTRLAIVDINRCKPDKCKQECKKKCPVEKQGKQVIDIENVAKISEQTCISCGICTNKTSGCPFGAISIINLPSSLNKDTIHRYGENGFKLHRLPQLKAGNVLGLIGANGTGKSTALNIIGYKFKPNFGDYDSKTIMTDKELSKKFRGTVLQDYFLEKKRVSMKPQIIEVLPKLADYKGKTVGEIVSMYRTEANKSDLDNIMQKLSLDKLSDRKIGVLSGGELQRFACMLVAIRDSEVYIYDEYTNYLDIKQRIIVANFIRGRSNENTYIVAVEHDLSIVDYMTDFVSILYGQPGAYGIVSHPYSTGRGINILLDGYIPSENMRIRDEPFNFRNLKKEMDEIEDYKKNIDKQASEKSESKKATRKETIAQMYKSRILIDYPDISVTLDKFKLDIAAGQFILNGGVTVLLGENGSGKSTFIKVIAGALDADNKDDSFPKLAVSYKPQYIESLFMNAGGHTVRSYLQKHIGSILYDEVFKTDVLGPLDLSSIMDYDVETLSGGQQQIVAIIKTLGTEADIYLLDEPSSFLDVQKRLSAAKAIKNYMSHRQKAAFIVEHDILMSIYVAHSVFGRVIVFDGEPGVKTHASAPMLLKDGMNTFLKQLDITFRQDRHSGRPKINKYNGSHDKEQKKNGEYFAIDDI